ncbi:MAG: ATP-dependent RecD-like DNA helicase [Defluviitaleaceae bacterium]|nr:ATP-dependent RecD-like DNA helicase [Defluviitaleaceae bacterium]
MEQLFVEGMLLREVFRHADNDFAICSLLLTGHNASEDILNGAMKPVYEADIPSGFDGEDCGSITISGYFPPLDETRSYHFTGKWIEHSRYGWQFQVASFKSNQVAISSKSSVIAYLSSDAFKGIGKKTATTLVEALGADAVALILQDRTQLDQVVGISKKQKEIIFNTLQERQGDELILGPLYSYGISPKFVVKILKTYEKKALSIIQENPYQLIVDIEGIGFLKADEIAKSIGITRDDPRRIRAALIHVMSRVTSQEGHTYLFQNQLVEMALTFLNKEAVVEVSMVEKEISELITHQQLTVDNGRLFLPVLMNAEIRIAKVMHLLQHGKKVKTVNEKKIAQALAAVKQQLDIEYSPLQEAAILTSLSASISLITGGPGTGKTTVVNGILKVYDCLYEKAKKPPEIKLASPTGRAAKRVEETTGRTATTIHRLLGYDRDGTFAISEADPLEADLVIIDEVSMLDTYLAFQLLTSLQEGVQVILVGDDNQLPSVGPGQVLKDLIESQMIPLTRLTEIHRQAEGSSVITLAHEVNHGRLPDDLRSKKSDRLFVPAKNEDILRLLKQVTTGAILKGYTARDVQILIPMYRGMLGIDAVNVALQELFNPQADDKVEMVVGQRVFREGDKVLQLVNHPDEGVMNGDVGEIVRVIDAGSKSEVLVDFDEVEVTYGKEDLLALTHAYAMSIHKSQGSEYPVVIMPITRAYWMMLQRKLIYTGMTRASKSLILIGDYEALKYAAKNPGPIRQTMLKDRLLGDMSVANESGDDQLVSGENPYADYFVEHGIPFNGIDEVGMAGKTPYDLM